MKLEGQASCPAREQSVLQPDTREVKFLCWSPLLLKPNVVRCGKPFAKRTNRRDAHDPISRMLAAARVMLILELDKFEVFHFKEEPVEHDDADLCLDELPEESLIVFAEVLRESAEAQVRASLFCERP